MRARAARSEVAREAIVAAGRRVLARADYRASMDDVAAEAGVARRTVFNHFRTKEALFEEILLVAAAEQLPALGLGASGDMRTDLLDFALRYARAITSEGTVALYRMLPNAGMEAAAKLAALQHEHYLALRNALVVYFSDQIAAGRLRAFHARFAAERFLTAVIGMERVRVSLGLAPAAEDRSAYIEDTVDAFLRSAGA